MKSMTGYGLARAQSNLSLIEVSLRSVNGRFLETRFHIPREYASFESDLKKILSKYFRRGTLDIFISRKLKPSAKSHQVVVNTDLAKSYANAYKKLQQSLKLKSALNLDALARYPDVIRLEEKTDAIQQDSEALLKCFEDACKACDKERQREGKSLIKDLQSLVDGLSSEVVKIAKLRDEANKALAEKFHSRIQSKLGSLELDAQRLNQEVVIQLDKSDINEELSRLQEHLRNYSDLLVDKTPQGKKLDFYTQELLREVNTIGSKSSVALLTQSVVEAKTLIERLREQVQNLE